MSEPADMNCDRANDLLVDLACGELAPELNAAVHKHAEGCARCGPELAKLTHVMSVAEALPLAEPSKAVEERILRAARESLAARAGGTEAREPMREASGYRSWFSRLSEWALSPQVAMASVLLLMVGIGLYALPIGREQDSVAFEATPDERSPATPAASATAAPAEEPTAADEAARGAGREPSKDNGNYESDPTRDEQLLKVRTGRGEVARKARSRAEGGNSKSLGADFDDLEGAAGPKGGGGPVDVGASRLEEAKNSNKKEQSSGSPGASTPKAKPQKAESAQNIAPFAPAPPPAPTASAPKAAKPVAPMSKAAPQAAQAEVEARQQNAEASSARSEAPAAADGAQDKSTEWAQRSLSDGVAAARRGAYAQAVSLLSPVVTQGPDSTRSSARLWLARSLRGQGKCADAVRYYAPLVQQAKVADEVLNEAADCYERTGDTAVAGKLRSRLNADSARE